MSVRVRFAPSPTGSPHVGNIRTALFSYYFAKHCGGVFYVRLEDTDRSRYVEGCEQEIQETLRWIGADWQEGLGVGGPHDPYRQSERAEQGIYAKHVEQLLAAGHAYKAFDTPAELDEMREFQQINKQPQGYFGGKWRDASVDAVAQAESEGKPFVIRLKIPRERKLVIDDAIRGRVEFDSDTVDDPVLIKGDGMPTYHCAAMIDDHLMGTTHIIRGEEWISSAPKHVWLFEAFGWQAPIFVHVPVIKGKDGSKLSKRHGDTRCLDYRAAGYMPEALANFIVLIGWAPKIEKFHNQEVLSPSELAEAFELEGLQPSPGVFDNEKLNWISGHYIRALELDELVQRIESYVNLDDAYEYWSRADLVGQGVGDGLALLKGALRLDPQYAKKAIALEQERVTTLAEFGQACKFFFVDQPEMDAKAVEKWLAQGHVPSLIEALISAFEGKASVSVEECEGVVRDFAAANGFEKLGPVVHPTRVALTGKTVGPGLFELMSVLGPVRMVARLRAAPTK